MGKKWEGMVYFREDMYWRFIVGKEKVVEFLLSRKIFGDFYEGFLGELL